jgi:hypothetical protein
MVKIKVKKGDITKFLSAWDKEAYELNVELKKMLSRQKKGQAFPRKKEGHTFRAH